MRFPRRPRYLIPALAAIVALIVLFAVFAGIWTDYLWFRSVHYSSVFTRIIGVKLVLFAVGAVVMALLVGANVYLAYRLRPSYRALSPEQQAVLTDPANYLGASVARTNELCDQWEAKIAQWRS